MREQSQVKSTTRTRIDARLEWLFSYCLLSTPGKAGSAQRTRSTWGKTWLPQSPSPPHWSHKWMDIGDTCQSHCERFKEERAPVCRCAQQVGHNITETLLNLSDLFPCWLPNWEQKEGWCYEGLALSRFHRTLGEAGALTQPAECSALPCLGPLVALPPQAPKLTFICMNPALPGLTKSAGKASTGIVLPHCLYSFFGLFFPPSYGTDLTSRAS